MTNSSLVGGKVGKKLEQLKNIQNVGSLLFSVNHDLILSYIFFYSGSILDIFYASQRKKTHFLLKVAKFHTRNPIFKVKCRTEWQKFAQGDDKR